MMDTLFPDKEVRPRYLVQIGKGPKGSYKTKYALDKENQAILYYNAINIGNGYKKRLIDTHEGKWLMMARAFS